MLSKKLYNNEFIEGVMTSSAGLANEFDSNDIDINIISIIDSDNDDKTLFSIFETISSTITPTVSTSFDYNQLDIFNEYNNNNKTIFNHLNFNLTNDLQDINGSLIENHCSDANDQEFASFEFWICGVILNFVGLLGILGNILSIITLSRPQMRSSINYLLIGLARCDTVLIITSILLFGIPSIYPYTGYLFYYYYYIYPNISPCMYPIAMAAQTSSVYMTLTVTLERYVAVCHPLKTRALCTYGRAKIYFIICILFAFVYNIPRFWEVIVITDTLNYDNLPKLNIDGKIPISDDSNRINIVNYSYVSILNSSSSRYNVSISDLFLNNNLNNSNNKIDHDTIDNENDDNVIFCVTASSLRRNDQYINIYIYWCYLIFIYFIPFLSLAILNCLIYRQVQKANRERQILSRTERREIGLATMLLCVVIVFFLLNFLALYTNILEAFYGIIDDYLIKISNLLVTINSSVNFIIYVIFGEKFKRIFLLLFCKGRMTRDTPDLIHYDSSVWNGDGKIRSSLYISRHGLQRSVTANNLNKIKINNNNSSKNDSKKESCINNNGIPTSVSVIKKRRIKVKRALSPEPCIYYPVKDIQRSRSVLIPKTTFQLDCFNNKSGGTMTSEF